jgi:hypothetical protein
MTRTAVQGLFDGARNGHREQSVFTPPSLLEPLLRAWGSIALDPCAHPDSPVVAESYRYGAGGLESPWINHTYINPPYANLKEWMQFALTQTEVSWAMLCPVRPHRRWWAALARHPNYVIFLAPVAFVGHATAFPAPLCIVTNCADVALQYERRSDITTITMMSPSP